MQLSNYTPDSTIIHLEKYKNYAILPGQVLIVKDKNRYCSYFQVFPDLDLLRLFSSLAPSRQYTFFTFATQISERNIVYGTPRQFSQNVKIGIKIIYNSILDIKKEGFIKKRDSNVYLLNPFLVWKGSQGELLQARNDWVKEV